MKRLILILGIVLMGGLVFGQSPSITGFFRAPNGVDTIIYIPFRTDIIWGGNFDYSAFDAADAVLDLRATMHADSAMSTRLDDIRLPFILVDSMVSFRQTGFPYGVLAIELTRNSVTPGLLIYYWFWR